MSAAGTVTFNSDGSLSFPEDVAKTDITLNNAAGLDVRGTGGGSITINARNLNLEAGDSGRSGIRAGITADSISADAQAGNIIIDVSGNITLNDSRIVNQVNPGGVGNSGNVIISTASLEATNGGDVDASTLGLGNAGLVEITASDTITIDGENSDGRNNSGATSQVSLGAVGNAGGVTINTGSLTLTNGGRVDASTFGQGNAGAIEITASDTITFDGEDLGGFPSGATSLVTPEAVGDAGGVTINTGSLNLTNGGRVSASTFGQGNAGLVQITASDTITFDGESSEGFLSGATSLVNSEAMGDAGGITITTGSLTLTNGGRVSANTLGQGNAGEVEITASDTITFDGEDLGGIPSGATSLVNSGVVGNAGGVTINTGSLTLTNGGRVSASTFGQGNAGDITVNARESIEISGAIERFRSGVSANALISSGNGGDVNVFTSKLNINDDGSIEASNFDSFGVFNPGTGQPGNINIRANSLSLTNEAIIQASTQSKTGNTANINLQLTEDLILRNNSNISARALGTANGGNIDIDADFIIAFPNQNNDIIARAAQGIGGNININIQGIFGIEERPQNPFTNDIDASSEFGVSGNVTINILEVEPTKGLVELPKNLVDSSEQIDKACTPGSPQRQSSFVVTGRGGGTIRPTGCL